MHQALTLADSNPTACIGIVLIVIVLPYLMRRRG